MRIIGHLDMDAFFAAIEERDRPRLRGLPIVVGADPEDGKGRGVVSTANYKAREYGIHSAMPITQAWRRSEEARKAGKPPVIFLSVGMKHYGDISRRIMAIVQKHVPVIEQASVDEAYMDLSFAENYPSAIELCQKIKADIKAEEKLTASIGLGPNKLIAKIASDRQKPDGLTVVEPDGVQEFLNPLGVRVIPGIGPKSEAELLKKGVRTVADLHKFPREKLVEMFGKWGSDMYDKARGMNDDPVGGEWEVKSVGEQETFREDTLDANFLMERLNVLAAAVFKRFKAEGFSSFRTVTITVRFSDFATSNRSHTLPEPVSDGAALNFEAIKLFLPFLDARENPRKKKIRLLGVRVEKLV